MSISPHQASVVYLYARVCVSLSMRVSFCVCIYVCVSSPSHASTVCLSMLLSLSLLHIDLEANVIDVTHHSSTPENN